MGHQQVTMSASNVPATAEAPAAAAFRYSAPYAAGPAYGYGGPQYGGAQYGGAMVAAAPGYATTRFRPQTPRHRQLVRVSPFLLSQLQTTRLLPHSSPTVRVLPQTLLCQDPTAQAHTKGNTHTEALALPLPPNTDTVATAIKR